MSFTIRARPVRNFFKSKSISNVVKSLQLNWVPCIIAKENRSPTGPVPCLPAVC